MVNRLADATSPYLLQHKDNPVDWHQWDETAFAEARERDVPVLLSVGYASCHWCHVMAHESFEDDETAADMNRLFVNIKVDREERPDVDRIYMDAVQAMTGRGGWPMTVFLTPDARPFFAGTYFPNEDRHGHPSFRKVLAAVSHAWHERRDEIDGQASRLAEIIQREIPPADDLPTIATLQQAYESLVAAHDPVNGGFGSAPKFPQAPTLEFLMRIARQPWAPEAAGMLHRSLTAMARGGIYDHLAGGFSRYSVDDGWLVPHFEKMLYDNALLARLYAHAWRLTGDERFETVARETLDYMLRDLGLPGGGFASAEDADSEGVEGKFYAFTHDEFMANGGERVAVAARFFGVTPDGNFEGATVLHEAATLDEVAATTGLDPTEVRAAVDAARRLLLEARSARVRPERDDKAITAWNGLALRALADAGWILDDERYIDEARGAAEFILGRLRMPDGRLMRSRRGDRAGNPGYCDDYAAAAVGLFSLYQATGEPRWFEEARSLTATMIDLFSDGEAGFFATAHDAEQLIARPKNLYDNPTPSDNSLAAEALLHVEALSGPTEAKLLDGVFRVAGQLIRHPLAVGHLLALAATRLQPPLEVAIVGDPADDRTKSLLGETREVGHTGVFLAFGDPGAVPLLQDRPLVEGHPAAYVCRGFACDAPVTGAGDLRRALSGDSSRND